MDEVMEQYDADWIKRPHPEDLGLSDDTSLDQFAEYLESEGLTSTVLYARTLTEILRQEPDRVQARFRLWRPREAPPIELRMQPRLESWMRKDHPDQRALQAFLTSFDHKAQSALAEAGELPLAVAMHVRLEPGFELQRGHDVDNYIFPVVRHLRHLLRVPHRRFVSARCTKGPQSGSKLWLEAAEPLDPTTLAGWSFAWARPRSHPDTRAYKIELMMHLHEQLDPVPQGDGVDLELALVTGTRTGNWTEIWKPTIDSLQGLLGRGGPGEFDVRDDRILSLGLHHHVDRKLGRATEVGIWWRPGSGRSTRWSASH